MKILLVSNMYPSKEHVNYGIFVKNFENAMLEEDVEFVNKALIKGKSQNVFEKIKKYFFFYFDIIRFSLRNDFDIIYVHYLTHSAIPFIFLRFFIKKPIVINVHGSDVFPISKLGRLLQWFTLHVLRSASLIVAPSKYFKNVLIKNFGISEDKIYEYPSGGINTSLFQPASVEKTELFFYVGFVSRLDFGKGWDVLVEAIKIIREQNLIKNLKVIVIGEGCQKEELLNMIQEYHLEETIKYLGNIEHVELPKYYNDMDVFVFPTQREESLGLVGLEAMSCGIPVIGSNNAGLKDYINNNNGFLFDTGDVESLKDILVEFYELSPEIKKKFSQNARYTAMQYDKISVNVKLKKTLEEMIN